MQIVALGPEFFEQILQLHQHILAENKDYRGAIWLPAGLKKELVACEGLCGVSNSGEMIGFLLWRPGGDALEITWLGTHPGHLRQRVMERLFASLIGKIAPKTKIWLEVHAQNIPARELYLKLGFRVNGQRSQYYRDGGDALNMEYIAPVL